MGWQPSKRLQLPMSHFICQHNENVPQTRTQQLYSACKHIAPFITMAIHKRLRLVSVRHCMRPFYLFTTHTTSQLIANGCYASVLLFVMWSEFLSKNDIKHVIISLLSLLSIVPYRRSKYYRRFRGNCCILLQVRIGGKITPVTLHPCANSPTQHSRPFTEFRRILTTPSLGSMGRKFEGLSERS
jgi:hypothetical protein